MFDRKKLVDILVTLLFMIVLAGINVIVTMSFVTLADVMEVEREIMPTDIAYLNLALLVLFGMTVLNSIAEVKVAALRQSKPEVVGVIYFLLLIGLDVMILFGISLTIETALVPLCILLFIVTIGTVLWWWLSKRGTPAAS